MDTSGKGYTALTGDRSHVTQGQRPQGFGRVDPAGHVTQVPLPPGGGESWPGYPDPEAPPAIYLEPQVTSSKTYTAYRQRASTVLGALQITAALVSTILNIAGILLWYPRRNSPTKEYNSTHKLGYGIWCSLFYIISGSLAIQAGKRARRGLVIGSTVMSTMSAIVSWIHIFTAIVSIIIDRLHLPSVAVSLKGHPIQDIFDDTNKASFGLGSVLLILGILEFIVSVWAASLGCVVTCCGSQATEVVTQTKVVYLQGPEQHSGQDGNTEHRGPGHPLLYTTYSTPLPEEVYDTIPDDLPEVSDQRMSCDTKNVHLTTDHSSPAGEHHYIQVFDEPDVGGVPPSSEGDYLQPTAHFNHAQGADIYLTTNTATGGNR